MGPVPCTKKCYHCGFENVECKLKYFNNKKSDQPRYQCSKCKKLFNLGFHGRPQGKTYHKKRGEDPEELRGLSRECPHCGDVNHAQFKYYNNGSRFQPRFKCMNMSCKKDFQMRLVVEGGMWYLEQSSRGCCKAAKSSCPLAPPLLINNASTSTHTSPSSPCDVGDDLLMRSPIIPTSPSWLVYHEENRLPATMPNEDQDFAELLETTLEDGPAHEMADGLMPFDFATYRDLETALDLEGGTLLPEEEADGLVSPPDFPNSFQTMLEDHGPAPEDGCEIISTDTEVGVSDQVDIDMGKAMIDHADTGIDANAVYDSIWNNEHLEWSPNDATCHIHLPCVAEGPPSPNSWWDSPRAPPESGFSFQQALDEYNNNNGDWIGDEPLDMEKIIF